MVFSLRVSFSNFIVICNSCDLDCIKYCNEETSCKSLIYVGLAWKRLPKFQHLLNDRQKWQKYPMKFEFPDPIVWKAVRGGEVRKTV
jgi:hypothetical protein